MEIEGINLYRKFKTGEILPPEGFKFDENDEKMLLRIVLNDFDIELEGGKDGAPVRIKKNGCKRLGLSNHYNLFGALTNEFGPAFAYKAADVHRDWYLNFDLSYICGFMPWILFEDVDEETRELVRKNARLLISSMPNAKNLYELTFSLREYIDRWILNHKEHTTKELEDFVVQTLIDSGTGKFTDIEEFEKKLVKIREDARERARNSVPESTCNCEKNHCREGEADSKLEKYIIGRLTGTVMEKNIGKYTDMDTKKLQEETPNLESISKYAEELAQKKEAALERWYKSQEAPKRVFHPFDKVVVRENNNQAWRCDVFSHMSLYDNEKYRCIGAVWTQCIPYEGNEHLVGTTDKPKED